MSLTPEELAWPGRPRAPCCRGRETPPHGELALHSVPQRRGELAAARHCFACSSYFPEVFQNCAPVNTNGAVNTSTPLACQTFRGKASSPTRAGALNLSFQGLKQTQRYQRASLLGIHQQAAVRLPPASGGRQRAALPLLFLCGRQRRSNLPLIVSHFPLSEFKLGRRMDG